jgi:glycosyltransferase involved in cell wall biosynthesis
LNQEIKSILFISAFGKVTEKYSNDRVCSLYDYFEIEDKTIVITDFDHLKKEKRTGDFNLRNSVHLPVFSYKSNIGLGRIISHWSFAWGLSRYLRKIENKPDVIYCLVPTPSSCWVAGKYANKHGIFFVSDIIDVWPDGLFPLNKNFNLIKGPLRMWRSFFNNSINKSDLIFAANSSYANIAKSIVGSSKPVYRAFLGSQSIDNNRVNSDNPQEHGGAIKICYGGSLGHIYDFDLMFQGIDFAARQGHQIEFVLIGGGDLEEILIKKAESFGSFRTRITGKINYDEYLEEMRKCRIGLNLFKPNELVGMSYKLYDYLSCNLYVFNTLVGDAKEIISEYRVGCQVDTSNFAEKLLDFLNHGQYPSEHDFIKVNEELSTKSIAKNIENLISYEKNNFRSR